ncbi:EAL domain-containing protein [Methylomicrobium sp. Wu6]|uniref:EAL domain-containing protein n=1 Tax=Methylomicrobium sp. Wu6 TaxID=3107928 RepID=UPI002DD6243D|nr:EAL domain-containing protein [Methylomicrobium sp. Wu6]MEC4749726.1 EAL domain-containing protein [Methylomicrobium sp. Wu6]
MKHSHYYVFAVQLKDPEHIRAVFGSAVVQVAHADITRGIEQFCGPLLSRYQVDGEVILPVFGRWQRVFGVKKASMRTDMQEQLPVLKETGAVMMRDLLIACFGQATGSRRGFDLIIAETESTDFEAVNRAVERALRMEIGTSQLSAAISEEGLTQLIDGGKLLSYFQPIVELQKGNIVGYEALTRGPVDSLAHLADDLFGAARYYGLTEALELACLRRAIAWLKVIPEPLWIAVNLGPALFMSRKFGQFIRSADVEPLLPRVVFELTEHVPVASLAALRAAVTALSSGGLRLSLDDTGCGFFDLTTVETMRPEMVKLCITVISRIDRSTEVEREMRRTIEAVATLGGLTLGEGVENADQAEILKRSGAALAQGNYFAFPKPARELFSQ